MTLERKKNITPRRQVHANNNNNNVSTASYSSSLSGCAFSPAAGLPSDVITVNNNVSCGDVLKSGNCLSSAGKCDNDDDDDDDDDSVDEPINSRNTPSAINILTSSITGDQFANR